MTDFRTLFDRSYLYSYDLLGRDCTVTIKEVRAAKVKDSEGKDQRKPILFFRESKDDRGLVLNKTNAKQVATFYGNQTEDWVNKRITLFPTVTSAFGATVECIRIRPQIPPPSRKSGEFGDAQSAPTPEAPDHAEINEEG